VLQQGRSRKGKEVDLRNLNDRDGELYLQAATKEWSNQKGLVGVREVPMEESDEIRNTLGDRIMRSRWCPTRKEIDPWAEVNAEELLSDDGDGIRRKAKMRWVVRGDDDPDLLEVESTSPAASRDGMMLALQLIASNRWELAFCDFTQAFCHGGPLERPRGRLFCEQPKEGIPGMQPGQLVELLKHIYGLTDGPFKWNEHVDKELKAMGYIPSLLDMCVYYLTVENRLQGIIVLSTDDMMHGGTELHWERMNSLKEKYEFGVWKRQTGRYTGKDVEQDASFNIRINQSFYAQEHCKVQLSTNGKDDEDYCDEDMIRQLRGAIGVLSWLAKETRADIAGDVARLQQSLPHSRYS